jgi:hypothetical protein
VETPAPCVPSILTPGVPGAPNVLIGGLPALDNTSTCACLYGGLISIDVPGSVKTLVP